MARAAVIIVQHGAVALIERRTPQRGRYYTFPGGVEAGESPATAAAREAWEELGLHVAVGPCVAEVLRDGVMQYHFVASVVGGTFGTGTGAEIVGPTNPERGTYRPVWLPLDALTRQPVFPSQVAALVVEAAGQKAWPVTQSFVDNSETTER